ncbi:hypothetical protein RRG08_040092 [Elysia crispata]|uniref:Uncharacterized protein n=1 Tax=Elysia crispata TaxID=231223 RepID=A0AAE0XWF6_9GAST|nr:hypothetical protein RRG08_040092 [Elysia crispata]
MPSTTFVARALPQTESICFSSEAVLGSLPAMGTGSGHSQGAPRSSGGIFLHRGFFHVVFVSSCFCPVSSLLYMTSCDRTLGNRGPGQCLVSSVAAALFGLFSWRIDCSCGKLQRPKKGPHVISLISRHKAKYELKWTCRSKQKEVDFRRLNSLRDRENGQNWSQE